MYAQIGIYAHMLIFVHLVQCSQLTQFYSVCLVFSIKQDIQSLLLKYLDKTVSSTFPGEIRIYIFEGHHYDIWGFENDALHNIFFPGPYARLWTLSVGSI